MSLLNNALREAEERQRRPEVAGAYTGAAQESGGGRRWLLVLLIGLALAAVAVGLYWFVAMNPSSAETVKTQTVPINDAPSETAAQGQVEHLAAVSPEVVERQQPAQMETTEPEKPAEVASVEEAQLQEPRVQEPSAEIAKSEEPELAVQQQPQPQPQPEPQPQPQPEPEPELQSGPKPAPAIKTTPQSPGAIDRQMAKNLEALIARGRMVEAERELTNLVRTQPAPRSRFTLARALLVDGETGRALDWLPESVAASNVQVRMLRARAQHAEGRLDAAVATLESRVPAVEELAEYRVTLATLLQQQGQNEKAALHWAELIAWDDSRAPWWVGLAIALEDQGEIRGATRAFEQAAALPGLSPSLADYVQRRLQSLRAG